MLDVRNGCSNAAVDHSQAMTRTPGYKLPIRNATGEPFALFVTKDPPLLRPVNDAIPAMTADGTPAARHEK